ncbi:hypothetical protein GCM10027062_10060 [Nocardioides hungaricus]|jgi:hypothetical protein
MTEGNVHSAGAIQMGVRTVANLADLDRLLGPDLVAPYADLLNAGGALLVSGTSDGRTVQIQVGNRLAPRPPSVDQRARTRVSCWTSR